MDLVWVEDEYWTKRENQRVEFTTIDGIQVKSSESIPMDLDEHGNWVPTGEPAVYILQASGGALRHIADPETLRHDDLTCHVQALIKFEVSTVAPAIEYRDQRARALVAALQQLYRENGPSPEEA